MPLTAKLELFEPSLLGLLCDPADAVEQESDIGLVVSGKLDLPVGRVHLTLQLEQKTCSVS